MKENSMCWLAELITNRPCKDLAPVAEDNKELLIKKFKIDTSKYDVIIGYRADDSYFAYAKDFVSGDIYREIFERAIRLGNLGIQVCIKSPKAYSCLQEVGRKEATQKDLKDFLKNDKSARMQYQESRRNNKSVRVKETIYDVLR